jgi:hypothetical protein
LLIASRNDLEHLLLRGRNTSGRGSAVVSTFRESLTDQ